MEQTVCPSGGLVEPSQGQNLPECNKLPKHAGGRDCPPRPIGAGRAVVSEERRRRSRSCLGDQMSDFGRLGIGGVFAFHLKACTILVIIVRVLGRVVFLPATSVFNLMSCMEGIYVTL